MHDIDGKVGLWVRNGFGESQYQLSKRHDASFDASLRKIRSAIAEAMKQLHYQAQKYLNVHPDARVLRRTRDDKSNSLYWDEPAPHSSAWHSGTAGHRTGKMD
jgi:hypothetical protein